MNFLFISSIDPLLLIPWIFVMGLAASIVFYFKYFSDVSSPTMPSRYFDIKDKKGKCKASCTRKVEKELPPHPKNNVLDPHNCNNIKVSSYDKKEIHKVFRIGKAEKDFLPEPSPPRSKGNTLDPRNNKGTRIVWAIVITALISIFYACIFAPLECLQACAGVSLAESMQSCLAFLFSALFPLTIFSFFVIIGERNNKKFLYCSLFVAGSVFLFFSSTFFDFLVLLSFPAIIFIYLIN